MAIGGQSVAIDELIDEIHRTKGIEGITILGGEPLQQKEATLALIEGVKSFGLTVFLYTGYTIEELDETMRKSFNKSDIVVSGRYEKSLRDTSLRWRGSTNQILHFPTGVYSLSQLVEQNEIEIVVQGDGKIELYGYPDQEIRNWIMTGLNCEDLHIFPIPKLPFGEDEK